MNRIPALDSLRGISLFGILIVNAPFFFMPEGSAGSYGQNFPGFWNQAATFFVHAFFEGKFILIFSFLFGWGLHTQMARGDSFKPAYLRRLLGLLIIGLLHAVLLFVGDILVSYAILGLPLLWMRDWQPLRLMKTAALFWFISILCHAGLGFLASYDSLAPATDYAAAVALHQNGSFAEIVEYRVTELISLYVITPFFFMPSVLGMFLVGLATAKTYAQTGIDGAKPLARQVLNWCALPALILNLEYGAMSITPGGNEILALTLRAIAVPLLGLCYIALAALVLNSPRFAGISKYMGGEGRMSLTLYVGESCVMGLLAYSYGFGLFGTVGPALQLMIAVCVYATLLLFSQLWLTFFSMGPMEWVLRSITQGRLIR